MNKILSTKSNKKPKLTTNKLVKISVLSVLAYILMIMDFPLPIFPGFLKLDFSDVPAVLGGFALGPVAGILIQLVKVILYFFTKSSTGGVGELANFLVGAAFVTPAAILYHRNKDRKHAIMGLIVGIISMTIIGALVNIYITLPFYSAFTPMEAIVEMGAVVNSNIVDIKTLVLYGITPFNILKGIIIAIITLVTYKKVSPVLKSN